MAGTCAILLSTYNGQRYLPELLASLDAQSYPDVTIVVRDDGSTDTTKEFLHRGMNKGQLQVEFGQNVGVPASFWLLLASTPTQARYVAFCDQDDVWKPDKLARAISCLEGAVEPGTPALYCSGYDITDENLVPLGRPGPVGLRAGFGNALVENIVTGCTAVLNRPAIDLLMAHVPRTPRMHDWWAYLVVSGLGRVVVDDYASLLYRQHEANTVGVAGGTLSHYLKRIRRLHATGGEKLRTRQAEEFRSVYGNRLDPGRRAVLDDFIDGRRTAAGRVRYALAGRVWRQTRMDSLLLRLLILLDRV